MEERTFGKYRDSDRTVIISRCLMEEGPAEKVLSTCLHEMYHAWTHCLIRLYYNVPENQRNMQMFRDCPTYIEEFKNYKSGENSDDFDEYYNQQVEVICREYEEKTIEEYYEMYVQDMMK